jgi:hypothetical protein
VRLAALLLFIVAGTHYFYEPLALLFEDRAFAARSIFYAARGIEGAALFLLLGLLARQPLVGLVCVWGAVEEAQTAVCRVAAGIGRPVEASPFTGLCGAEMYWFGALAAGCLAVVWLDTGRKT